ncbi:phosphoribosylanthranilate isomerase [Haliea sp. AH-315-K21]|uniref:N-(5'-phosphoribosyl)anthranilate isomerase n=1 Tax=SAR86 cluster bacterium TaxID=2030880 RepID=A0A2A5CEE2_9GAMM|nr:phosphoribosylanthranilate isomerase [Haliea sp. AH-315-K21]MBN4059788.1 phosphoribosylanthranilate isomerase [bacterium AH-315-I11]MBN4075192.1 phosphoribosylanthranilate isomerase [Gammaproteobacteria bacterium AH-315-E17]PCJ42142.1 MAG: phosphoribosylanthranilate isomerase [SAR86 cluster bacterium]
MTKTRTRIKICGITRTKDALAAVSCGVDALGLVFVQASPRHVPIEQAQDIVRSLPALVSKVGLFVDASVADVTNIINKVSLDYLQFHGDEEESFCTAFSKPYIKAIRIKPETDLLKIISNYKTAAAILIDAWHPDIAGGTGETFDWALLNNLPKRDIPAIILAGGLDQKNVNSAVRLLKPYAVDVSSGVEDSPGIKSAEKIQNFVNEVNRGE